MPATSVTRAVGGVTLVVAAAAAGDQGDGCRACRQPASDGLLRIHRLLLEVGPTVNDDSARSGSSPTPATGSERVRRACDPGAATAAIDRRIRPAIGGADP